MMDIRIHPLVVLHVADHWTRDNQQSGGTKERVLGALMGEQVGRVVKVLDAIDLVYTVGKDGAIQIKTDVFELDLKLCKEAFPRYECLGWYTTNVGGKITNQEFLIHKQVIAFNERPLLMMFDPKPPADARDLPVVMYEEVVHIGASTTSEFVATAFKIESEEAERVTAVHCAKVIGASGTGEGGSIVVPHYITLIKAINTLNTRVRVLRNFLNDVSSGKFEMDHKILRAVKGLINKLPTMDSLLFKEELLAEYNDALLVTYLATVTKSTQLVNDVLDKFNSIFTPSRRRGGPLLF